MGATERSTGNGIQKERDSYPGGRAGLKREIISSIVAEPWLFVPDLLGKGCNC